MTMEPQSIALALHGLTYESDFRSLEPVIKALDSELRTTRPDIGAPGPSLRAQHPDQTAQSLALESP